MTVFVSAGRLNAWQACIALLWLVVVINSGIAQNTTFVAGNSTAETEFSTLPPATPTPNNSTSKYSGACFSDKCKVCEGPAENDCIECKEGFKPITEDETDRDMCVPFHARLVIIVPTVVVIVLGILFCCCCYYVTKRRPRPKREKWIRQAVGEILGKECTCVQPEWPLVKPERASRDITCAVQGFNINVIDEVQIHKTIYQPLETRPALRCSTEEGGTSGESQPNSATLLKRLLEEYDRLTTGFSPCQKMKSIFQLPCFAISYFNEEGGSLSLKRFKVNLYIPRGAIPKDTMQKVYIYVNPNAPPVEGISPPDVVLSPVVECGPTGLKFLDSVVLSFPHHATESSGWHFSARISEDDDTLKTWRELDGNNDGTLVSTVDKKATLLLKHFTGAVVAGQPSPESTKTVMAGVFGCSFQPHCTQYAQRIHVWNDDPVAEQKVVDIEAKLKSEPLDAFRYLEVYYNQGDVNVEVEKIRSGWGMEENSLQIQAIAKSKVWKHPSNSVTFDLTRQLPDEGSDAANKPMPLPGCDAFVYQLSSETAAVASSDEKVRLSARPKRVEMPAKPAKRKNSEGNLCSKCQSEGTPGFCSTCQSVIKETLRGKTFNLMDGDYAGLPEKLVPIVCEQLEPEGDSSSKRIKLDEDHFDVNQNLATLALLGVAKVSKEALKIYCAKRRAEGVTDKTAVEGLLKLFREEGLQKISTEFRKTVSKSMAQEGQGNRDSNEVVPLVEEKLRSCPASTPLGPPSCQEKLVQEPRKSVVVQQAQDQPSSPATTCPTPSSLASEIADQKLFRRLAKGLGPEWEALATELDFTKSEVYKIKMEDPGNVNNQIFQMLVGWRQRRGELDSIILADSLEKVERNDLAEQLREATETVSAS